MQQQEQTQWCWAAVSNSVAAFYNPASTWTQCKIVNAELTQADCCVNGSSAACNKPWYLDKALTRVGHFASPLAGVKTTAEIDTILGNNTPLGVRVGWAGGGGHFLGLSAHYLSGAIDYVTAVDPWYGKSEVVYNTFKTQYQGSGTWTHSYLTKKA
jgi:hypothetical protein